MTAPDPESVPESGAADDRAADPSATLKRRFESLSTSELDAASLLGAMGGVRGLIEAMVPGIAFLVLFTFTKDLVWSVAVPAAIGVVFVIARAVARQNVMPAVGGLIAIAVSGFLAMRTGNGEDFFLIGFYTNAAYGVGFLLSMLVGWPLIGYLAGLLYNNRNRWRDVPRVRRLMQLATAAWVAFFALRLAVQLPLYFAGNVEALGVTRLVMGTPMYAVLAVATVLFARAVFRASGMTNREESAKVS